MDSIKQIFIIFILTFTLAGCGGGSDDAVTNTPTDPTLDFSTFPSTFFNGNYTATYSLTGSLTSGSSTIGLTAIWDVTSGNNSLFNSQSVNPIMETLEVAFANNQIDSVSNEDYYSTDVNDLQVLGSYNLTSGVTSTATTTNRIPLTAKIGESGNIGTYSQTDGNTTTVTWVMEDGFNGRAKLAITYTERNASNVLESTETHRWIIEQSGRRIGVEATSTSYSLNATLTASGTLN